jgi:hypothetical protein
MIGEKVRREGAGLQRSNSRPETGSLDRRSDCHRLRLRLFWSSPYASGGDKR